MSEVGFSAVIAIKGSLNRVLRIFLISVMMVIVGCTTGEITQGKDAVQGSLTQLQNHEPVITAESKRLEKQKRLLAHAKLMLNRDRLMVPAKDSAYFWYQQVLALDENNTQAHAGMENITQRYLQLAKKAFSQGDYDKVKWMLNGAEKISAPVKEIEKLRKTYQRPASADNEYRLEVKNLNARNDDLMNRLGQVTDKIIASQSRMLIVARNDAEGRWLYQQMRQLAKGYRVRGNIKIGSVPRIILIDLDKS